MPNFDLRSVTFWSGVAALYAAMTFSAKAIERKPAVVPTRGAKLNCEMSWDISAASKGTRKIEIQNGKVFEFELNPGFHVRLKATAIGSEFRLTEYPLPDRSQSVEYGLACVSDLNCKGEKRVWDHQSVDARKLNIVPGGAQVEAWLGKRSIFRYRPDAQGGFHYRLVLFKLDDGTEKWMGVSCASS